MKSDCNDLECRFKQLYKTDNKEIGECSLELPLAIEFLERFGATTCELGASDTSDKSVNKVIDSMKYRGRIPNDLL